MIVLDTHAVVWWVTGDAQLSRKAKQAIANEQSNGDNGQIILSSITSWEIALLVAKKRLALAIDVETWLATVAKIDGVRFCPIDTEIATKAVLLPGHFHKDPADRMIVATARKFAAPLITKDEKIRAYGHVKTIW